MAPYAIAPDEALVLRGRLPACRFANVMLWNRYLQSYDYMNRRISLNRRQMQFEPDGSYRIVIAHRDPGVPNWLDSEGRTTGQVYWRIMLPEAAVETPQGRARPARVAAGLRSAGIGVRRSARGRAPGLREPPASARRDLRDRHGDRGLRRRPAAPTAEPEPAPIAAGDAGSHPVVFQKTLFRIPVGTPLSVTRLRGRIVDERNWESSTHETGAFNVTAADELKRLGYDVRDASDSVFTPSSTIEARYQMAAIVHALTIDPRRQARRADLPCSEYETLSSQATMEIEFQLFDSLDKKLVVKKRVEGRGVDAGRTGQPMPSAFLAALRKALADPAFVAPLRREYRRRARAIVRRSSPRRHALLRDRALTLPVDLPRAQEAVVVVVVGSGSGPVRSCPTTATS